MDQVIVKIIVFMKKSYPPKNIFGLLSNIRAFIKVVILKNTEILEYLFILIQALNRWWAVLYVSRSMRWNLVHLNFKPFRAFWPDNGQKWLFKCFPFFAKVCL